MDTAKANLAFLENRVIELEYQVMMLEVAVKDLEQAIYNLQPEPEKKEEDN